MYKILVCVDGNDDRAREQAAAIAAMPFESAELEVVLLHVFTENPEEIGAPQVSSVRAAVDVFETHDIEPEIIGTSGTPEQEIRRVATENDIDLLSLGGRKRSPAGKAIFGSVTQAVILESDRPVICQPS